MIWIDAITDPHLHHRLFLSIRLRGFWFVLAAEQMHR